MFSNIKPKKVSKLAYKQDIYYAGFIYNIVNFRTCCSVKIKVEFLSRTFLLSFPNTLRLNSYRKIHYLTLDLYLVNNLKFLYRSINKSFQV